MKHFVFMVTIAVVVIFESALLELLPSPRNQCKMFDEKETVTLECNSTLKYPLTWLTQKPGSSHQREIYNGFRLSKNLSSSYKVLNGKPGGYELNVNATQEAAQRYICLEPGTLTKASAEVTIIESVPQCNVTWESEYTTYTCQVRFKGNWAPAMTWTMGNNSEIIDERVYNITSIFLPNESLTNLLVLSTAEHQNPNVYYACTTKFRMQEKPYDTTADNIPEYNYTCIPPEYTSQRHISVHEADNSTLVIATCLSVLVVIVAGVLVVFIVRRMRQHNISNESQDPEESKKFTQRSNNSSSNCRPDSKFSFSSETGYSSDSSNDKTIINK